MNKEAVLNYLNQRLGSTLPGTAENRLIKKLTKDVNALEGEELKNYLKNNYLNSSNSWRARYIFSDLYDLFTGKE